MADFLDKAKSMLGMGPAESISEKYARLDRERAAKQASAAPAPVATPAPQTQLGGVNLDAMKRREAAAGLKDGGFPPGRIKGPGTATSDSIRAKLAPGAFVAPADSTQQLQDVRVSNGEAHFSPELVSRVGAAALLAMRDVTHMPAAEQPEAFADGGLVPDDQRGSSYTEQLGNVGSAIGTGLSEAAKALTSYPVSDDGNGYGLSRLLAPSTPATPSVPGSASGNGRPWSDARNGSGGYDAGAVTASTASAPALAPAVGQNDITRMGNSYSGGPNITADGLTINGRSPGGGMVSANNEAAANALDARERLASVGRVQAGGGASDSRSLGSQVGWAGDPSNPQVYVKSAAERLGTYGNLHLTPQIFADKWGSAALNARMGQEQGEINAERSAATSRYGADSQAATARGAQTVTSQDNLARQMLAKDRFGLDSTAAGIDARLKGTEASARERLLAARTPDAYVDAEDRLRALQGNRASREPNYLAIPGGTDEMGNRAPSRVFDQRTGTFVQDKPASVAPPTGAVSMLKSNPAMAAQFDAKYGPGAAARVLGQK